MIKIAASEAGLQADGRYMRPAGQACILVMPNSGKARELLCPPPEIEGAELLAHWDCNHAAFWRWDDMEQARTYALANGATDRTYIYRVLLADTQVAYAYDYSENEHGRCYTDPAAGYPAVEPVRVALPTQLLPRHLHVCTVGRAMLTPAPHYAPPLNWGGPGYELPHAAKRRYQGDAGHQQGQAQDSQAG